MSWHDFRSKFPQWQRYGTLTCGKTVFRNFPQVNVLAVSCHVSQKTTKSFFGIYRSDKSAFDAPRSFRERDFDVTVVVDSNDVSSDPTSFQQSVRMSRCSSNIFTCLQYFHYFLIFSEHSPCLLNYFVFYSLDLFKRKNSYFQEFRKAENGQNITQWKRNFSCQVRIICS